jgi:hypothetical protein
MSMYPGEVVRLVAALVSMFAYLILRSKLAEYRIDDIRADSGMGRGWGAARDSMRASNYSPAGQRWLLWLRISFVVMLGALVTFVLGPHAV